MEKLSIVLTICILMGGASAFETVRIAPRIDISRPEEGEQSSLGVVNGVRSCGGVGKLVQLRYETCEGHGICKVPGDDQLRRSELEFIPSQDSDALGIRFLVITDGEVTTAYERPISDSAVQGGERYAVNAMGGASEDLKGKTVIIQYYIYRVEDSYVEVCSEADIQVI